MKRTLIFAATFGLALGAASATRSPEPAPEARAYVTLSFGGARLLPRDFHYGLRIDHDSRFVDRPMPPIVQLDFTSKGLGAARVNGLNVLRQDYRLRQAEDLPASPDEPEPVPGIPAETPAEEPAAEGAETAELAGEEPGFFSRLWRRAAGIFGGGDDEATADETTEGSLLGLGAVDWGLVAVGAVAVGVVAGSLSGGDDGAGGEPSGDTSGETGGTTGGTLGGLAGGLTGGSAGGTTGGTTTGETTGGTTTGGTTGDTTGGLLGDLGGLAGGLLGYTSVPPGSDFDRDVEYRKWLDGGTGQMGDLGGGD